MTTYKKSPCLRTRSVSDKKENTDAEHAGTSAPKRSMALAKASLRQPHLNPMLLFVYQTSRNTFLPVSQQTGIKQFSCLIVTFFF